jgi:hypothetical protein
MCKAREINLAAAVMIAVAVVVLAAAVIPMPCQAPISRPPYRGCRHRVYGLFGRCRSHGQRPGFRLIATLGGQRLSARRICSACGRPAGFARARATGKPFLGCTGFPECRRHRWLAA